MKKNYKKLFGYAAVMIACVLVIVLMAALSENRIEGYQTEYEQAMTAGQKQVEALQNEIEKLTKENDELKKAAADVQRQDSDLVTASQAYSDLKGIYDLYKSGKISDAKKQFSKIEPMGFDDITLDYYEVLKALLNK